MFNPNIVDYSELMVKLEEGCLSFPGLHLKIKRPENIRMRYDEPNGNRVTKSFSGLTARIIQHEYDHLHGLLFYTRGSVLERDRAWRRMGKLT
jgi:peptide deformylase